MKTFEPFLRNCSATRAKFSLKITTLCHSVRSLRSPEALSFQFSEVAILKLTTGSPELSRRTSGSLPRLPTRMTLFTLPAMGASPLHAFPQKKDIESVLHLFCVIRKRFWRSWLLARKNRVAGPALACHQAVSVSSREKVSVMDDIQALLRIV